VFSKGVTGPDDVAGLSLNVVAVPGMHVHLIELAGRVVRENSQGPPVLWEFLRPLRLW
jgi:hypothetical protein